MPSPRKKEIIINSKINSVLKKYFKDNENFMLTYGDGL